MVFTQSTEIGGKGFQLGKSISTKLTLSAGLLTALVLGGSAQAQFTMVADINPGGASSSPGPLVEYTNGTGTGVYFAATTATNGRELWASGGAAINTFEVLDINPGSASSNPTELTLYNGKIYFAATGATGGRELWVSDGTAAGTMLAANIAPAAASSNPQDFVVCGGYLFFSAETATFGREVYRFDGTTATRIADIFSGSGGSNPLNLFCHNNILYFSASNGSTGQELYIYNTTTLTLVSVDIDNGAESSSPSSFAALGNDVYFAATRTDAGANTGRELWRTSGTAVSTALFVDIFAGTSSSNPTELTTYGSQIVFAAMGSTNLGVEPWRTNGTVAGTIQIDNLRTGANNSSDPHNFRVANGVLYFAASVASPHAPEPFAYNGTTITSLGKIGSGNSGSFPAEFSAVGGSVYFAAQVTGQTGREIWVTQGTSASTAVAQDINPGAGDSAPHNLFVSGGGLWFAATNGTLGVELWRSMNVILAVELDSISASADDEFSPVTITWTTAAEIDNVGFHVYRAAADGSLTGRITNELIAAESNATSGATYSFVDPLPLSGPLDIRLYYLVDVDLEGAVTFHEPVPVRITSSRGTTASVESWMQYE